MFGLGVFVVLLAILGGGFYWWQARRISPAPNQTSPSEEQAVLQNPSSNQPNPEDSNNILVNENVPEIILGASSGRGQFVNVGLEFTEVTLEVEPSYAFTLESNGFDLGFLGQAELAIEENVYPRLGLIMGGRIDEIAPQEFSLRLEGFTPQFFALNNEGEAIALPLEIQQDLLSHLQENGVSFPVVSPTNPLRFPVEISQTIEGGFQITSQEPAVIFTYRSRPENN